MCLCHNFRTSHCKLETKGQNAFWYTCQQVINSVRDLGSKYSIQKQKKLKIKTIKI